MNETVKHFKKLLTIFRPRSGRAHYKLLTKRGFTLVEILVAITIVSTLIVGAITTLNPKGQLEKTQDAVRQKDLQQIKLALDLYYSDTNCYPSQNSAFTTSLKNGAQWKEAATVYMKKVPKDSAQTSYTYITDDKICPQWATIFAKLSKPSTLATSCPLTAQSDCTPTGFDDTYACVVLGTTNCSVLLTSRIGDLPVQSPTPTPTPTGTTPTPTPASGNFTVALNANPQFYQGTLTPMYPAVGNNQTIAINIADPSPVSVVTAKVYTDTKTFNVTFSLTSGTNLDGKWTGTWNVADTINRFYKITFFATDAAANQSSVDVVIR